MLQRRSTRHFCRRRQGAAEFACFHHLTGFMMEQPLADVRTALATLGFARVGAQTMVEDHLSALCEVMRLLIVGGSGLSQRPLPCSAGF